MLCFIAHKTGTGTYEMLKLAFGEEIDENANISLVFQGQKRNDKNIHVIICLWQIGTKFVSLLTEEHYYTVSGLSGKIMERPQNFLRGSFIFPEFKLVMEGRNFDDIFTIKEQFQAACAKFKIQDLYSTCCIKCQKKLISRGQHGVRGNAIIMEKTWNWYIGYRQHNNNKSKVKHEMFIKPNNTLFHTVQVQSVHAEKESSVIVLYLYILYFRWPLGTKQAIWSRAVTFTHNISTAFKAHR